MVIYFKLKTYPLRGASLLPRTNLKISAKIKVALHNHE